MQKLSKYYPLVLFSIIFATINVMQLKAADPAETNDELCIRVFSGYDKRAPIGHHVFQESILHRSSMPATVTPLYLSSLQSCFTRPKAPDQLTDFTYSRFIIPYLCGYKGWAIFMDGNDMILREDIAKLWSLRDDSYAVMVVKHPEFKGVHSFGNKSIQSYPMLNWSSVMLMNTAKCKALTPEYVNTAGYYDLHQFKWLDGENLIGDLPKTWNHLVGYYDSDPDAAVVHWTLGAPYMGGDFAKAEHADEWFTLRDSITAVKE